MGRMRQYLHAKCLRDNSHLLADSSKSDDTYGLACQLDLRIIAEAEVRALLPAACVYGFGMMCHAMADFQ